MSREMVFAYINCYFREHSENELSVIIVKFSEDIFMRIKETFFTQNATKIGTILKNN